MGDVLNELLDILKLEKIEENFFRGKSQDIGFGNLYGGQVLGQALSAASYTVDDSRSAHSLHAYFIKPGDANLPIIYEVDPVRDGKSFTTRRVKAIQKGSAILTLEASFQLSEEGFDHQTEMPAVPGPDGIMSESERLESIKHLIPVNIREKLIRERPIEFRHVNPVNPFAPEKMEPLRYIWFKTIHKMPDDLSIHKYLLAYASDYGLVGTALYPHGHTFWEPELQVASLDHAMWFHRDFRMDDWLLYVMDSPSACSARGLNRGTIFSKGGTLVASTIQEGLIRYHKKNT